MNFSSAAAVEAALPRDTTPTADDNVIGRIAASGLHGVPSISEYRDGVRFLINEFWTSRQRQAHRLHEISYRACFKPQLPEFFIDRLTQPGDTVYDPFMGRGTTPLQAAIMGRHAIGNDINPVSRMLVRPRVSPPTLAEIKARLEQIDWSLDVEVRGDLTVFYHPDTLREIEILREWLQLREQSGAFDGVDDWLRMIAINRLTGHSPGFFSVYSLPPNQAVSLEAQRKINLQRGQSPPRRDVPAIILKKSRTLLTEGNPVPAGVGARFLAGPAEATTQINDRQVDLVVTSPPFLDVVQYPEDNWLRCWFAGVDSGTVPISMHKSLDGWTTFIGKTMQELARAVRPGGHVAFEVGEVRGGKVELEWAVLESMKDVPFTPLCVVVNAQEFTKTANCWGVSNNSKGTNTNRIVLARRN